MEAAAYRYILEPYTGPASRHTCPECGKAGAFVRYIDTTTGEALADNVGRCNREDSCGYHYKPGQYFADNPDKAHPFEPVKRTKTRPIVREWKPAPPLESYTIPAATLNAFLKAEQEADRKRQPSQRRGHLPELFQYLCAVLGPDRWRAVCKAYRLCSYRGAAVFWYIDREGHYRTGKRMYYHENGHRNKDWPPSYIHSLLKAQGQLPEGWTLRRCLFGEHLLPQDPAAPVAIVESEKTALIAAALCPGPVWLAAGGKHYLNADTCAALRGRRVIAYPDLQAFEEWQHRLADIAQRVGFAVEVSDILERTATAEERAAGLDIADYLIKADSAPGACPAGRKAAAGESII